MSALLALQHLRHMHKDVGWLRRCTKLPYSPVSDYEVEASRLLADSRARSCNPQGAMTLACVLHLQLAATVCGAFARHRVRNVTVCCMWV